MNQLKFLSISIIIILSVSDRVYNQDIRTTVSSYDPEIIQQGIRSFYAILREKSSIRIDCAKINGRINGTIIGLINKRPTTLLSCNSYYNSIQNDYFCINKTFIVDLNALRNETQFNVECRIVESGDVQEIVVYQIFEDYLPRIRQGSVLNNNNSPFPLTYNISVVPISCEVIAEINQSSFFDEVRWFPLYTSNVTADDLNMTTDVMRITSTKDNYTTNFQITATNQAVYTPNSHYKCCTLYRKALLNCQIAYIVGYPSTLVTTTKAPITTTTNTTTTATTPKVNATTTVTTINSNFTTTAGSSNTTKSSSSNTTQSQTTINPTANPTTTDSITITANPVKPTTTTNNGNGQFTNSNSFSKMFVTRFNILFAITFSIIFLH